MTDDDHGDHYQYMHTPDDTIDKLNLTFFEQVTKGLVAAAFDLASR